VIYLRSQASSMHTTISGLHHVTAICKSVQENIDFYEGVLGLRLVKVTVNFDDPSSYHLYYGNETGDPGTLITFFPHAMSPRRGNEIGGVSEIRVSVPTGSLDYWRTRLETFSVRTESEVLAGEQSLAFEDADRIPLRIVESRAESRPGFSVSGVEPEHSIRGLHSVQLMSRRPDSTQKLLSSVMGYQGETRLTHPDSPTAGIVDVIPAMYEGWRPGKAGTIHHVAFNLKHNFSLSRSEYLALGYQLTEQQERNYFKSLYFMEPGGTIFELASPEPGFLVDEALDSLGTSLMLPSWLEPRRNEIESNLLQIKNSQGKVISLRSNQTLI
jgi:glyoxalase family protein